MAPPFFSTGNSLAVIGARGGYAFRCDTGPFGATWFFKKPTPKDAWGVRVSVKSLPLAVHGLGYVRAMLHGTLDALNIAVTPEGASVSRVDYAVDILDPDFALVSDHFVMHSRCTRIENREMEVAGTSGHATGVRLGKMPGLQVAVYDKRADVIAKRKTYWWEIWNANLAAQYLPPCERSDPHKSRVWRFEIRAGKRLLKDKWKVRTWAQFDNKLGDMFSDGLRAIRYVVPSNDSNVSRWPNHPHWETFAQTVGNDLFEMANGLPPELVKRIIREEHARLLETQMTGLSASLAVMHGLGNGELHEISPLCARIIADGIDRQRADYSRKLERAGSRYYFLNEETKTEASADAAKPAPAPDG